MYHNVLSFWFEEVAPSKWWQKDADFDQLIIRRFAEIHAKAIRCELFEWRITAEGRLAEIIVLDQFSRNMFRGSPQAFGYDSLALALAQEAIAINADKSLPAEKRSFFYTPFMHSESLAIHAAAVDLYKNNGIEANTNAEIQHKNIIERFNRYPHRNEILGRTSTEEEIQFLTEKKSSF